MSREDTAGPGTIKQGDFIEIIGVHDASWEVLEVRECIHGTPGAFRHEKYRIPSPEGQDDWWCFYKVRKDFG